MPLVGRVDRGGVPKTNRPVVSNSGRETDGVANAIDQLVEEGRIVERDGPYWLPEHAPDGG